MRKRISVGLATIVAGMLLFVADHALLSRTGELKAGSIRVAGRADPYYPAALIAALLAITAGCLLTADGLARRVSDRRAAAADTAESGSLAGETGSVGD